MFDKLINNKKLLLIIGIFLFVGIIIIITISLSNQQTNNDTTDSSAAISDLDLESKLISENPFFELLPLENSSPYYIIDSYFKAENKTLVPAIEIVYKTESGKTAAEARLTSSEFSQYNPAQYNIIYTKLDD